MKNILTILLTITILANGNGQSEYYKVYTALSEKLSKDSNIRFKDIVFMVESAFDEQLNQNDYMNSISFLSRIIRVHETSDSLLYKGKDKDIIKKYSAIFKTLTDTTRLLLTGKKYDVLPIHYDFDDFFGEKNWKNMFVTKLLATKKGNCHSMPYLYKILCEELGVPCWLPLAHGVYYFNHPTPNKRRRWCRFLNDHPLSFGSLTREI